MKKSSQKCEDVVCNLIWILSGMFILLMAKHCHTMYNIQIHVTHRISLNICCCINVFGIMWNSQIIKIMISKQSIFISLKLITSVLKGSVWASLVFKKNQTQTIS